METIWIIGAGKFGIRAAKWLLRKDHSFEVTLVDQDKACLDEAENFGCKIEADDGITFLYKNLTRDSGPDWIVPAVPVHLAWEWSKLHIGKDRVSSRALPRGIEAFLPNPMNGAGEDIYVSHANFL